MEVSIVIISYNRRDFLKRCIESVLKMNTNVDFEIVVIDQGSTDGTLELIKEYMKDDPRIRLVVYNNPSLNAKRNKGIQVSKAEIVGIIDDDIVVDENWVNACLDGIKDDVEIITGQVKPLNKGFKTNVRISPRTRIWGRKWFDRVICWRCGSGCNLALRKRIVEKIGYFDEEIGAGTKFGGGADDTEFFFRAMVKGCEIRYVPEMIAYHPQPTQLADYVKSSYFYYVGISHFVRIKYPLYPSAICMVIIRFLHSLFFFIISLISFDRVGLKVRKAQIQGTLDGLKPQSLRRNFDGAKK